MAADVSSHPTTQRQRCLVPFFPRLFNNARQCATNTLPLTTSMHWGCEPIIPNVGLALAELEFYYLVLLSLSRNEW